MSPSTNKTTLFRYNADGKLVELVVLNDTTGTQMTKWVYGTTKTESGVASNELVRAKIYPDSDDQGNPLADGADTTFDRVEYRYNTLGEVVEMKDQNQTVHEYLYDQAGRLTADKVTALGTGVDGAVRTIGREYDARGQLASVTSYEDVDLTTVINQVEYVYNGFGQVLHDYQAHSGTVDTGSTPAVSYEYENGTGNTVRQTALIYPNGRQIHSHYGTAGSIDDLLDRVRELRDTSATGTALARYTKRGTNATVVVEYPEPTVELTYLKQGSEPDGDAGDQYTGLDRFNRIEDIRWLKRAGSTITDVERVQYGFDRASNRTWRKNLVAPPGFDEAYEYDGLYQLSDMRRGNLNINHTTIGAIPVWEESWNYDSAGNWKDYTTRVGGDDPTVQTRTHNKVNEITFIDGNNTKVGYDGTGNMTVMPKVTAPGSAQQNTWDAWNRLVKVMEGATTIGSYAYDGLTRRIAKTVSGEVRHGYFTSQWQLIEERTNASETAERQFVWGLRYLDDLILRDCSAFSPTRLYTLHDQWHITGVVDTAGVAQERYIYSAFGVSTVFTGAFGSRESSSFGWETRYGAYRFDRETALYCVRYRYLHPTLGRWMSRDPIGEAGGVNLLSYVRNRITRAVDVFGLQSSMFSGLPELKDLNKCAVGDGTPPELSPGVEKDGTKNRNCIAGAMGLQAQEFQIPQPLNADGTPNNNMRWDDYADHVDKSFSNKFKNCRKTACKWRSLAKKHAAQPLFYTPCEKCEREVILNVYLNPDGAFDVHAIGRSIDCNEFKSGPFESVKGRKGPDISNITDVAGHFDKYCGNTQKYLCYCCKKDEAK